MTKAESALGYRTRFRFVEELGRSIREMLVRKDPDPKVCDRDNCFPCMAKPGACMRQWALYRIECKEANTTSEYVGESARTLFNRGLEHWKALQSRNKESPLVEHEEKGHNGIKGEWTMAPICFPKAI